MDPFFATNIERGSFQKEGTSKHLKVEKAKILKVRRAFEILELKQVFNLVERYV